MNILYLGNQSKKILEFLKKNHNVRIENDKLDDSMIKNIDFIVSYGYRFIIEPKYVDMFERRAVNLHISYLPWNKGADPNLWSFLEDTPKGVSIHYISKKLDDGEIIAQEKIKYYNVDTLKSTYERLTYTIENLFVTIWNDLISGKISSSKSLGKGSYHRSKDKDKFMYLLDNGWNTCVEKVRGKGCIR